jgi:hypothetical protein
MYRIEKLTPFESSDGVTNWMNIIYKSSLTPSSLIIDKEFNLLEITINDNFANILVCGTKKEIIEFYEQR